MSSPTQLEKDLEAHLVAKRERDVVQYITQQNALIVFAETHVGRPKKAPFLASIVQALGRLTSHNTHFHASEHYINDAAYQVAVQNYVWADDGRGVTRARRRLPEFVREYEPVLEAARHFAGHRYAILCAGSHESDEDVRHAAIYSAFNSSISRHNSLFSSNQITRVGKGNFLIGEFHATRQHTHGRGTATTSMRLIKDGWNVHIVRLSVNAPGGFKPPATIVGGESLSLEPRGGGDAIDLLPMLNRLAGKTPFVADIRGSGSPFGQVRIEGGADLPYNEMVDVILHLP